MELLKELLNIGGFRPGFYLYLGRYIDDRDLKILGWKGPFQSRKAAKSAVPSWWQACGLERPRVGFRWFAPYNLIQHDS